MRSLPEWRGKNDDAELPGNRKVRLFDAANARCQICRVHLIPGHFAFDHIVALANGGENRETNIQVVCDICHAIKTKKDVALKAQRYRKRKKLFGIEKTKSKFPNARDGKFKTKIGGRTEPR